MYCILAHIIEIYCPFVSHFHSHSLSLSLSLSLSPLSLSLSLSPSPSPSPSQLSLFIHKNICSHKSDISVMILALKDLFYSNMKTVSSLPPHQLSPWYVPLLVFGGGSFNLCPIKLLIIEMLGITTDCPCWRGILISGMNVEQMKLLRVHISLFELHGGCVHLSVHCKPHPLPYFFSISN